MTREIPAHTQRTLDSGRICSQCGGKLEGIETIDNSGNPTVWAGCNHCSVFNNGVPENVFKIASKLVVEEHERPYSHMSEADYKTDDEKEYFFDSQTGAMSRLVWRILSLDKELNERNK